MLYFAHLATLLPASAYKCTFLYFAIAQRFLQYIMFGYKESITMFLNTLRFAIHWLLISIPRQARAPQGLMIQVRINRKQLYVYFSTKWVMYYNICPLQSLFTPAQPRVIISEKVGAEIGLFPVSVGHQVWPKSPFLADGRILLSAQGLGQQARTLVLLLLYWEGSRLFAIYLHRGWALILV